MRHPRTSRTWATSASCSSPPTAPTSASSGRRWTARRSRGCATRSWTRTTACTCSPPRRSTATTCRASRAMRVLAFETSCDETAVAVVRDGRWIESNLIASQVELHRPFGGIVPEAASRAHLANIVPLLEETLAGLERDGRAVDAVAVTSGPGLAGALLVGVNVAKAVSYARSLPLLGLNHLEGHVYANWLVPPALERQEEPRFPLICLIVSGAHSDLV